MAASRLIGVEKRSLRARPFSAKSEQTDFKSKRGP